uniref:Ig-like domain-containing protein n=1 Tax=Eptatretus burgeri TaxID=7764 RepID=A0A8C4QI22_EPTBU
MEDAGEVRAVSGEALTSAKLVVQEAPLQFVKRLEPLSVEEGQIAELSVEVSRLGAKSRWTRNSAALTLTNRLRVDVQGMRHSLIINPVCLSDRGVYACEVTNDRTQARLTIEPRCVLLVSGLKPTTVREGGAATFRVELSHSDVDGKWSKDAVQLYPGNTCQLDKTGKVHSLTLSNLQPKDVGIVAFQAEGVRSSSRLSVEELPAGFTSPLEDVDTADRSPVTFTCEVSRESAEVKWFKDGVEIRPSHRWQVIVQGRKRGLQIMRCELTDAGGYRCSAGENETTATLVVHARDVLVLKPIEDQEVMEEGSAIFTCEFSHDDINAQWFRNDKRLRSGRNIKTRQTGKRFTLTLDNVQKRDAGEVKIVADSTSSSSAKLVVKEPPVHIVKRMRDKISIEGHRVILECQLSRATTEVHWFHEEAEITA